MVAVDFQILTSLDLSGKWKLHKWPWLRHEGAGRLGQKLSDMMHSSASQLVGPLRHGGCLKFDLLRMICKLWDHKPARNAHMHG